MTPIDNPEEKTKKLFESIVGKGEIIGKQRFLLSPQFNG